MKMISGDPGKNGALVFWEDGKVIDIQSIPQSPWGTRQTIPDANCIRGWIDNFKPDVIVLERVTSSPRAGVSSTGTFLQGFGILIGCCAGYRLELIRPQVWKSATGLTGLTKSAAVDKAILKQPRCEGMIRNYKNKIDRADAVLIGTAWRILNKGGEK